MRSTDNTIRWHKSILAPQQNRHTMQGMIHIATGVCNYAANSGIFVIDPRAPPYTTLHYTHDDVDDDEGDQFGTERAMSEMRRDTRSCSDFSIARILAKDQDQRPGCSRSEPAAQQRLKLEWLRSHFCKLQKPDDQISSRLNESTAFSDTSTSTRSLHGESDNSQKFKGEELSWLRCTRYCPPKLPRKSYAGKNLKRKPGSHPRIPFTKHQLDILEEKYKTNAYLSRKDVVQLSEQLNLPQSRIKIWFQNRRARERRESVLLEQKHTAEI